jgi:membrane protease YdiL (CAAX protease family)
VNWWDDNDRATLIAYGLIAVPALVAVLIFRPRPMLPLQRLRYGSWNGGSVLFHGFLLLAAFVATHLFFEKAGIYGRLIPELAEVRFDPLAGADEKAAERVRDVRRSNLSEPLGALFFLAMSFSLLPTLQRTPISRAGMTLARWGPNILLGLRAFLVVTPVVLAIHVVCSQVFKPEQHPFEVLGNLKGLETFEWFFFFANVVVLGPIFEEWLFRGLLQGWLRRATYLEHAMFVAFLAAYVGIVVAFRKLAELDVPIALVAWTAGLAAVDLAAVYLQYRPLYDLGLAYFRRPDLPPLPDDEAVVDAWTVNLFGGEGHEHRARPWRDFGPRWILWKFASARWSIFGSAMFFALAHGTWPTPLALFFLGLALGWLAFRTQSLVPSMIVHGLFNLVSFLALVILSW